jgi:hypothetical protein
MNPNDPKPKPYIFVYNSEFDHFAQHRKNNSYKSYLDELTHTLKNLNITENVSTAAAADNSKSSAVSPFASEEPRPACIDVYLNSLMHTLQCTDPICTMPNCKGFKGMVQHSRQCIKYMTNECITCRAIMALVMYHAKECKHDVPCPVPFCRQTKNTIEDQRRRASKFNIFGIQKF